MLPDPAILSEVSTLPIPARFGSEQAAEWIRAWSDSQKLAVLRLVLAEDARLEPAGIALLAAGIASRQIQGLRTWLDAAGGPAFEELTRLGFQRELGVESRADAAVPGGDDASGLRRLRNLRAVRELADSTRDLLEARQPPLSPTMLRAAHFVFEELGANVVQHSGRPETGFGLARAEPRTARIQIAFADAGMGFRASLEQNPEFAGRIQDEGQAIRLALDRRITRGGPGNMGMGLYFLATLAEAIEGDLWVASGTALYSSRPSLGGQREVRIDSTVGWTGAWISLDAPAAKT